MHPSQQVFRTHGGTFTRACRDQSVESPLGRWNMIEAQPAPGGGATLEDPPE